MGYILANLLASAKARGHYEPIAISTIICLVTLIDGVLRHYPI